MLQLPHDVQLFPGWWMHCHVSQHGGACREQSGQLTFNPYPANVEYRVSS